jgi:hypothetical protein
MRYSYGLSTETPTGEWVKIRLDLEEHDFTAIASELNIIKEVMDTSEKFQLMSAMAERLVLVDLVARYPGMMDKVVPGLERTSKAIKDLKAKLLEKEPF